MNLRDQAILKWLREKRPDLVPVFERLLDTGVEHNVGLYAMLAIAFEAGRQFQHENPTLELDNPNVYLNAYLEGIPRGPEDCDECVMLLPYVHREG